MTKQLEGHEITEYAGTLGTFDIEHDDGDNISYDQMVVMVVVATAGSPKFSPTKSGLKETYSFKASSIKFVDGDDAVKVLQAVGTKVPGITPEQYTINNDEHEHMFTAKFLGASYA